MDDDLYPPLTDEERKRGAGEAGGAPEADGGEIVTPIPTDLQSPSLWHPRLGQPVASWVYRNADGEPVCYIARFNKADGEKEFRPRTLWRSSDDRLKWLWKNLPAPRPLCGLELLAQRPDAKVMVVEGEKCADIARLLFPDYVVVSPMNGAKAPHKTDWGPLRDRDPRHVVGLKGEQIIAALLKLPDRRWETWNKGKPLSSYQLSRILRDFQIVSQTIRDGNVTFRGYPRDRFKEVFTRYSTPRPQETRHDDTTSENQGEKEVFENVTVESCDESENRGNPSSSAGRDDVTEKNRENEGCADSPLSEQPDGRSRPMTGPPSAFSDNTHGSVNLDFGKNPKPRRVIKI
jgi:hypothetical protein